MSSVDHPEYYGGEDNVYEVIKIIDAWELDFTMGNVIKYALRAGRKGVDGNIWKDTKTMEDLKKARWYLDRRIQQLEDHYNKALGTSHEDI